MTKKVFNRLDPFIPVKINGDDTNPNIIEAENDEVFENLNITTLNESLKFSTPQIRKGFIIMITRKSIGNENGLGEKLLEDFIYSISDSFELPQYLIFMNEAVLLLRNENIENLLSRLQKYGVKNMVSLESLNYFKYKVSSKIFIQATSGDIAEKILFSKRLINI